MIVHLKQLIDNTFRLDADSNEELLAKQILRSNAIEPIEIGESNRVMVIKNGFRRAKALRLIGIETIHVVDEGKRGLRGYIHPPE